MFIVKKPLCCSWISLETWDSLNLKEKDYIIFLYARKFTKEKIMRMLHIEDRTSYWRLQRNVKDKIKSDVARYNEHLKNNLQKL